MNARHNPYPVALGAEFETGYFAGQILVAGKLFNCCLPPKATSEHAPTVWNHSNKRVEGALSFNDSEANTRAMAAAGSKIAQWALDSALVIPALDVLEQLYRIFKPTADHNSQWMRSGINLSAVPPTMPYALQDPAQTAIEAFRHGGAEAFDLNAYWSSTQSALSSSWAWSQLFDSGTQHNASKSLKLAVRAVRMIPAAI